MRQTVLCVFAVIFLGCVGEEDEAPPVTMADAGEEPDAPVPGPDGPTESDAPLPADGPVEEPDAGAPDAPSGCASETDCTALPCATARCVEGECLYALADADSDGFFSGEDGCPGNDCDDSDDSVHPGVADACDGVDNDCDAATPDGAVEFYDICYPAETDGCDIAAIPPICYGACSLGIEFCVSGEITCVGASLPVAESCDGADNDCDNAIDDGVQLTVYVDADGDDHGSESSPVFLVCELVPGLAESNDDCNDSNETTFPGAPEVCGNGADDDCNGAVDEFFPPICVDADFDGFGNPAALVSICAPVPGTVGNCSDCDDTNPVLGLQCEFEDSVCGSEECGSFFVAGSFGEDEFGGDLWCFCDEVCLEFGDCCDEACEACGVCPSSEPPADGGVDGGVDAGEPASPPDAGADAPTPEEPDAGEAPDAGLAADAAETPDAEAPTSDAGADATGTADATSASDGAAATDAAEPDAPSLPAALPARVTWTMPDGEQADAISLSYMIVSSSGVLGEWVTNACTATATSSIACEVLLAPGQSLVFSVQYTRGELTSWSCLGAGAAGVQNGTAAVSWNALPLTIFPVSNGGDGCNLAATAPDS